MTRTDRAPVRGRIAFVGAGHVGATAAFAMMLRALFEEIVLIDSNQGLAQAEAADLADANALARPARIWAGDYADAAQAQIAVITAGAATHGDESRLTLAARSATIVAQCAAALAQAGFDGVLIVAANPVDLMSMVAMRQARIPWTRVLGTGTLLDTSRLRQALAVDLHIAPGAIEALVLGEHGDSEVAAFSTLRVAGQPLATFTGTDAALDLPALAAGVRDAGYRIIGGKGFTSYGIATAIVRICEAVIRDERTMLPVSVWQEQFGDVRNICLSLPCIVGANGIERVVHPVLDAGEEAALHASARTLRDALEAMDLAA